eukprot:142324_1
MFSISRNMPVMFELFLLATFLGAVLASNGRSYDPARSTLANAFSESNIPYDTTNALPTVPAFKTDSNGSNYEALNVLPTFPAHDTDDGESPKYERSPSSEPPLKKPRLNDQNAERMSASQTSEYHAN